jgi:hypothetical protein
MIYNAVFKRSTRRPFCSIRIRWMLARAVESTDLFDQ